MLVLILITITAVEGSEENLKVVLASDILAKINNGEPVEYNHTTIIGNLSFGKLNSQTKVLSLIKINDSIIRGNINFYNVIVQGLVCFDNTQFNGDVNFIGSTFNESVNFENAKFEGDVNFRGSRFDRSTYFRGSYFNKDADFSESNFNDFSDFSRSKFKGSAYIEDTTFNGNVYLNKSHFEDVFLEDTIFNWTISLDGTKYEKIYVRWSDIERNLMYNENSFISLIDNFKKIGFNDDANDCYYRFKREQLWDPGVTNPIHMMNYLSYTLLGFGMRPTYSIIWGVEITIFISIYLYLKKSLRHKTDPTRRLSYVESIRFSISRMFKFVESDWEPLTGSKNIVLILDVLGWIMYTVFIALLNKTIN